MEMATSEAVLVARGELRTRTALVLEAIALHHQIAVLERIQTRRPCFRRWDRLLWDGDTALHTRTGDFILDHGYIPTTDPFSFTKPGQRWIAFQWLTGVAFSWS